MEFPGFYANEQAKARLSALVDGGRLPQAIILEGEQGLGKRTLARLIAAACVCKSEGARPCTTCSACKKALSGNHADIMTVAGGASARSFGVDKIRAVRSDAIVVPNEADVKFYLLFEAHQMTEQAQNALLKILEEPPPYAHFILTCESSRSLLETVRSRAVIIRLAGVGEEQALKAARSLVPQAGEQDILRAARLWGGNIGRIVSSLSDGTLAKADALAQDCCAALLDAKETALLCACAPLIKDKELARTVYSLLLLHLHDGLKSGDGRLSVQNRLSVMACVRDALAGLDRYLNQPLLVTRACAAMRRAAGR